MSQNLEDMENEYENVNRCLECGTVMDSMTDQLCRKYYCSNTDYLSPKDFPLTIIPGHYLQVGRLTDSLEQEDTHIESIKPRTRAVTTIDDEYSWIDELTEEEKKELLSFEIFCDLQENIEYMQDRKQYKFGFHQCDDWLELVKNKWQD